MSRLKNFSDIQHNWSSNLPVGPGTINSLGVKTIKQIININTTFRDNYNITSATDYIVKLPQTLKNVISLKLYDHTLPKDIYSISDYYHNNKFMIRNTDTDMSYIINISDGTYSATTLDSLNTLIDNIKNSINTHPDLSGRLNIEVDPNSYKTKIINIGNETLELDFSYRAIEQDLNCNGTSKLNNIINNDYLTLGWLLGFRGNHIKPIDISNNNINQYPSTRTSNTFSRCMKTTQDNVKINFSYRLESSTFIISEGLINLEGENNLFLSVNDFHNNHNNVYISVFKNSNLLNPNILGKLTNDKTYIRNTPARIYFGPTDIDKLGICIHDAYGRIYNNNFGNYCIELEVERIYDGK